MQPINRRGFIGAAAGAAAVVSGVGKLRADGPAGTGPARPPIGPLGPTGIEISRVGLGTGMRGSNRQSDHSRLGFEQLVGLFRHAYDRGVTFFDMADLYGTHVYCREALRSIPREKVTILTKIWWRYDRPAGEANAGERRHDAKIAVDRFRHELATDYLDIVLLHCLIEPSWEKAMEPYMEALAEKKEKKEIRAVGVSCHNFGAMETAASSPWVDVLLARFNPKGVKMDGTPDEVAAVLRKAKENGKAVIGMKILGEGILADEREACIQFAQESGLLDAMTIGCMSPEQLDDILHLVQKYPAKA